MYPSAPGQHDTVALPPTYPPSDGTPGIGSGDTADFVPGSGPVQPSYPRANPEAEAWRARYLLQRTRTRVAVVVATLAALGAVGMGVLAWRVAQANPLLLAAGELARGGGSLDLEGILPDGASPVGEPPGESESDGAATLPDVPLSELSGVPDEVKSLAAVFGITDFGQLLDLAVSFDLMTRSEADQLRAAVAAGVAAGNQ